MAKQEPTEVIDYAQVRRAVAALKGYLQKQGVNEVRPKLFEEGVAKIGATVNLKLIPTAFVGTVISVNVPHRFISPQEVSLCLIVRDIDQHRKHYDYDLSTRFVKEYLDERNVKCVDFVISMSHLIREYTTFADKQRLAKSYDVFLVDKRLPLSKLYKVLGNPFRLHKKLPIPVNIGRSHIEESISKAVSRVRVTMTKFADKYHFIFGNNNQSVDELLANFEAVMEKWKGKFPGGLSIVRSLYIHSGGHPPLPVYASFLSSNSVVLGRRKSRVRRPIVGELSTLRYGKVRVYGDGSARIVRKDSSEKKPLEQRAKRQPSKKTYWRRPARRFARKEATAKAEAQTNA
ncbi:Ribosomal L1 domain containing protein [Trichuris trichiura]|uniref:Ribosomal L1 domain containing protein n=1 Tax=Trichuris trichiura TaxID=36087 RepID=A0A077Z5H5_TRITR|nr:Ribosomal L1 domain containing protein [Trichuris trichiura]